MIQAFFCRLRAYPTGMRESWKTVQQGIAIRTWNNYASEGIVPIWHSTEKRA